MKVYKIGDKVKQTNKRVNQYAEIIDINYNNNLCSVKFEDGTVRKDVKISSFANGGLSLRGVSSGCNIGKEVLQNCGHIARLISYNEETEECSVKFDNGVIRDGVKLRSFLVGSVGLNPKYKGIQGRVGLRRKMSNGFYAEVINAYEDETCDVRFDDGSIRKGFLYKSFLAGDIGLPRYGEDNKKVNIGDKAIQECGMTAEVIAKSGGHVDIRFDDGTIRKSRTLKEFREGLVPYGNRVYVGTRVKQNCGEYAECIELEDDYKCSIKFDSGLIKKGIRRFEFKSGRVSNKDKSLSSFVNKKVLLSNGLMAECFGVKARNNVLKVLVSNGIWLECTKEEFLNGTISIDYNEEWNKTVIGFKYKVFHSDKSRLFNIVFESGKSKQILPSYIGSVGKMLPDGIGFSRGKYIIDDEKYKVLSVYWDKVQGRYVLLVDNNNNRRLITLQ